MQNEAAAGLDRTAAQNAHRLGARRQANLVPAGDDVELDQQLGEFDLVGALIDDDPHRAIFAMGAEVDDRSGEGAVPQGGHGDEELALETGRRRRICPFHSRLRGLSSIHDGFLNASGNPVQGIVRR